MSHTVKAGDARPAKRSALLVGLVGWLSSGIYTIWWWSRTNRDLAAFEGTGGMGSKAAPTMDTVLAIVGFGLFVDISRMDSVSSPTTFGYLSLAMVAVYVFLVVRLRGNINRASNLAGLLPEERQSGVLFFLAACLGPIMAAAAAQEALNSIWERYPRYFKSIGGTREELDDAPTPTRARQVMPVTSVSAIRGFGPAASALAPASQAATAELPVLDPTPSPAERMVDLAPRAATGAITPAEAFEYASAIESVHGVEEAGQWYRYTMQVDPTNLAAAYWYGCFALDRGDELGISALHSTLGSAQYDAHARAKLVAYFHRTQRPDEAARYAVVPTTAAA